MKAQSAAPAPDPTGHVGGRPSATRVGRQLRHAIDTHVPDPAPQVVEPVVVTSAG